MNVLSWLAAGITVGAAVIALSAKKQTVPGLESDGAPLNLLEELAVIELELAFRE